MHAPAVVAHPDDVTVQIDPPSCPTEDAVQQNPEEPVERSTSATISERFFLLQCTCERNSLLRGNELDRQLKSIESGVSHTGALSGLYTSKPFSALLVRRPAKIFIILLILYFSIFIWQLCFRIDTDFGDKVPKYASLRFLSDNSEDFMTSGVASFGPTYNSFALTPAAHRFQDDRLILEYAEEVLVNGFYVMFSNESLPKPTGIELSRSSDGKSWEPIYRNSCWHPASKLPHSLAGSRELVDAFETWAPSSRKWCYIFALAWLLAAELGSGFGCMYLLAVRRVQAAKHSFVFGIFAAMTCWMLISAIPWKAECLSSALSIFYMATNVLWFTMGLFLAIALWTEKGVIRILAVFGVVGALHCVAQLLDPVSENTTRLVSFSLLTLMNVSFSLVPLFSYLLQRRFKREAQRLVADDMATYRRAWGQLVAESAPSVLGELSGATERLRQRAGRTQHLNRQGTAVGSWWSFKSGRRLGSTESEEGVIVRNSSGPEAGGLLAWLGWGRQAEEAPAAAAPAAGSRWATAARGHPREAMREDAVELLQPTYPDGMSRGVPGSRDGRYPVESLDQLYLQACALHPALCSLVRRWAASCEGYLPAAGRASREEERPGDGGSSADGSGLLVPRAGVADRKIRWSKLKSTSRAIEKAVRSYGGDVSLVVDICRQNIVFKTLADLLNCLQLIERDPAIRVLRVKNRLDPDYDDSASAGYRDVALNLLVITEETMRMGVENHVCELQLIPWEFYKLKTEQGHQRYVSFRNMRAE